MNPHQQSLTLIAVKNFDVAVGIKSNFYVASVTSSQGTDNLVLPCSALDFVLLHCQEPYIE